nr:GNAT family N-acetyltransferase [Dyella sp. ASV21]
MLHPITTPRALIRVVNASDAARVWRYRVANREHLAPWEPLRDASYFTVEHCIHTLAEMHRAVQQDRSYAMVALDLAGEEILASFTLANVMRGSFQACHLGYSVAAHWQGLGLMREVLGAALPWAFHALDLHRVMANYMPSNQRSGRLLEHLGFEREGYAKQYLQIAGRWEDHILTARLRTESA